MEIIGKICTGFGHRDCGYWLKSEHLIPIMRELIESENVDTFYTGGNGDFDSAFSSAVRSLKVDFTKIKLCYVSAYFKDTFNRDKEYYKSIYDEIVIPEGAEYAHPKAAIKLRNRWMVDNCDVVISGVTRDHGGAYDAIEYAQRHNKTVLEIQIPKRKN